MQTKFKIHLVAPRLGLTFCRAKAKGNTTRKVANVTCKNCIRAFEKHEAVMNAIDALTFHKPAL